MLTALSSADANLPSNIETVTGEQEKKRKEKERKEMERKEREMRS